MINKTHTFTIHLASGWTEEQRQRFRDKIINPLITEIAANWPSAKITEAKEDSTL